MEVPMGHLVGGDDYPRCLIRDLEDCRIGAVIASSWIKASRVKSLAKAIGDAVRRGVEIEVFVRQPKKHSSDVDKGTSELLRLGCKIRYVVNDRLVDTVVIDESLVWTGSIAPLAYPRKNDCSLRFVSREVAADLIGMLGE